MAEVEGGFSRPLLFMVTNLMDSTYSLGTTVLPIPHRLDEVNACAFVEHAFQVVDAPRLLIDLGGLGWVEPFGTLVAACGIRAIIARRKRKGLATKFAPDPATTALSQAASYLRAFGFFDYVNRERASYRAPLRGGQNYLPITRLSLNKVESDDLPMQESVDRYSDRLAAILFPESPGAQIMLGYSFREIIRNAFEHADVEECVLMAQRWNQSAEIAIADAGRGIHSTIQPVHLTHSPEDSIGLALKPGIRGLTANVDTGRFQNTGFGRYVEEELGSRYGEGEIQSSERGLIRRRSLQDKWVNARAIGTCVKLKISLEDGEYFPNILGQIVAEGEALARSIPGAVTEASGASKSPRLSQD